MIFWAHLSNFVAKLVDYANQILGISQSVEIAAVILIYEETQISRENLLRVWQKHVFIPALHNNGRVERPHRLERCLGQDELSATRENAYDIIDEIKK